MEVPDTASAEQEDGAVLGSSRTKEQGAQATATENDAKVKATGRTRNARTGDDSHTGAYLAGVFGSAAALLGAFVSKLRRRRDHDDDQE
ncbi:LPXTG-motif cell wall anchor domain-containing protein [Lachnospiraceae bacterium NK3A20]|nr:LPXTG-motif cell wall anchor domain-containing protein [Lachnospiraceae bacterium NK3A20]